MSFIFSGKTRFLYGVKSTPPFSKLIIGNVKFVNTLFARIYANTRHGANRVKTIFIIFKDHHFAILIERSWCL